MIESRRRAYLDALGLDIWKVKPPEPLHDRLVFQLGEGSTLLICDAPDSTASRFAGDIKRALAGEVVWAWPDPEGSPDHPTLDQAVADGMFTRVVLFGASLGHQLFAGPVPPVVGSARITLCESMDELAVRGTAKRTFWRRLCGLESS